MRARTLVRFNDLKENKVREVNSEFEASKERVEQINSTPCGALVEVIKEKKETSDVKPPVKNNTKKSR